MFWSLEVRSNTYFFLHAAGAPSGPETRRTASSDTVAASRLVTKKPVQQTISMAIGEMSRSVRKRSSLDDSTLSCPVITTASSSPWNYPLKQHRRRPVQEGGHRFRLVHNSRQYNVMKNPGPRGNVLVRNQL